MYRVTKRLPYFLSLLLFRYWKIFILILKGDNVVWDELLNIVLLCTLKTTIPTINLDVKSQKTSYYGCVIVFMTQVKRKALLTWVHNFTTSGSKVMKKQQLDSQIRRNSFWRFTLPAKFSQLFSVCFFLWGFLKSKVDVQKSQTLDD